MRADIKWLENPEVFRVNRLDAHSDHHFYLSEEDMLKENDSLRQSLNGRWKFYWSKNPDERPRDFYENDAIICDFKDIEVPGHIELWGYGQIQYTNIAYPWDGYKFLRPPHIDWENNPVGSYVKEFDLNDDLRNKRVYISFQGVEQAIYVWLNGEFVGYAEDSFTPSEFELTDYIKEKNNRLCLEVYKRSSAAWLEDQDFFRFSGIFRDVYLFAKPSIHVEDLFIKAGLDEDYSTGIFELSAKLLGNPSQVSWELLDKESVIAEGNLVKKENEYVVNPIKLKSINCWDVGKPYLYKLIIRVLDEQSNVVEVVPYKVGFRRFEIKDKVMNLNGKRLVINGINRHEWNPRRGRAITKEDMLADIEILKRNGINAVRTCHYPNQSLWYELCDEAGICVLDEANLESHGTWQKLGTVEPSWNVPGSEEIWKGCVLDRAISMLERDKNHPSILWWSCGNESHVGTVIQAVCEYFHEMDSSRLVHYEGTNYNREFDFITDVESRMYATPADVREYMEGNPKKPMLLCEYMHDMGNSLGGLEHYMKLRDEFSMFQGGFIWDYIDQALYYTDELGNEVLGYGGDFGDRPTNYSFSANGMLDANRKEKPAMEELRYWYMQDEDREKFHNKNLDSINLAMTEAKKELDENEEDILRVEHSDYNFGVIGKNFHFMFSFEEGGPVSIKYNGKECVYRAPRPAFWRATTENDLGNGFSTKSAAWFGAESFSKMISCKVLEYMDDFTEEINPWDLVGRAKARDNVKKVSICYTYDTTVAGTTVDIIYTVYGSGRINVKLFYHGKDGVPQLPLFGIRFVMPDIIKEYSYKGLSGETYPDRKKGAKFGLHQGAVNEPPYIVPQEYGNHTDTVMLIAGGLRILMENAPFNFSLLPYSPVELENALHVEELPKSKRTILSILGYMRGVGGFDSWGSNVREEYQINAETDLEFSFNVMPV